MHISGRTRIFALVGDPIDQARSPILFNSIFRDAEFDGVCLAFEVKATEIATFLAGIKVTQNVDGIFVTTPHKRRIVSLVDELTPTASISGSVNVARRRCNGKWRGAMFDGSGCVLGLRAQGIDLGGRSVLLFGCGGAGRSIGLALAGAGARRIALIDQSAEACEELAELIATNHPQCDAVTGEVGARDHDVFVNASTLGMRSDDASPFHMSWLSPQSVIVDLVTEPENSQLGLVARTVGCRMFGGQLVHQGQAVLAARFIGFEYWPENWPKVAFDDLIDD